MWWWAQAPFDKQMTYASPEKEIACIRHVVMNDATDEITARGSSTVVFHSASALLLLKRGQRLNLIFCWWKILVTMKLAAATIALSIASASAFAPCERFVRKSSSLNMGFDLSGNNWKPDSEKMGVSMMCRIWSKIWRQFAHAWSDLFRSSSFRL